MSFMDAVKTCFSKYVDFSGRARKSEFWWFFLFTAIVGYAFAFIGGLIKFPLLGTIVQLALALPSIAVAVRRLHDIGKTGWLVLVYLIPLVGLIMMIVWGVKDGDAGQNAFGPNPKEATGAPAAGAAA